MPNSNAARGLVPVRYRNGSPYMGAARTYYVPASDATALFVGDPVVIAGSADSAGTPTCTIATAGARFTGVVVGFRPTGGASIGAEPKYRAASTAGYVLVADEPNLMFEVQEDSVGGSLAATNTHQNCDLIAGAGSTATGYSGWMLDSSTAATTNTLQTRIIGLQVRVDNDFGTNAKWLVANNNSTETGAAGSLGV